MFFVVYSVWTNIIIQIIPRFYTGLRFNARVSSCNLNNNPLLMEFGTANANIVTLLTNGYSLAFKNWILKPIHQTVLVTTKKCWHILFGKFTVHMPLSWLISIQQLQHLPLTNRLIGLNSEIVVCFVLQLVIYIGLKIVVYFSIYQQTAIEQKCFSNNVVQNATVQWQKLWKLYTLSRQLTSVLCHNKCYTEVSEVEFHDFIVPWNT